MKLIINNTEQEFEENTNLELVIIQNNLEEKKGIAVAVNEEIIPKNEWSKTVLFDKDKIIIIGAVAGG